ncbi:hypothetical protein BGZ54_002833 [Gamsiella multidivaricata]|nr:hypothetical protein BGZ54_002833 [Gamsiella multidivaricata]
MTRISVIPHPQTLSFYRSALRALRLAPPNSRIGLAAPLAHLRRKLQYNIRDGISIYRHERECSKVDDLIRGAEQDIAMIQAWRHIDPSWLERIFKKPTAKKS